MTFHEKVKLVREKLHLSQEALARELQVSFATVNRWESGKREPSIKAKKTFYEFCKRNEIKGVKE